MRRILEPLAPLPVEEAVANSKKGKIKKGKAKTTTSKVEEINITPIPSENNEEVIITLPEPETN